MKAAQNLDPAQLEAHAGRAARLLRLLANEKRLMVLCRLMDGERSVSDLAERVGLSVSALSQHLGKLRADGLVETRRDGQTIWYRVGSSEAAKVLHTLADIYCPAPA